MAKTEKDKTLDQVLADIEKQFGKGSIMKLGEQEGIEIPFPRLVVYQHDGGKISNE